MRIDLHTHSTASDGTERPSDVVRAAAAAGVDVLALTDHDSTAGWAEAADAARDQGLALLLGAEVSCSHRGISVHVLSYLHDPRAPGLLAEMEHARQSREHRAERIVELLVPDFPRLTWDAVLAGSARGATLGRPHIADALVSAGYFASRDEVFATVLHPGSGYYVPHYAPDPCLAVSLVRQAGGVPVFAHPRASRRGRTVGDDVLEGMVEAGLAGLEVDHRDHDPADRADLRAAAQRYGLFVTGSSDYHGAGKPNLLAENTTDPLVLDRILEQGTGTAPVAVRRYRPASGSR